MREWDKLPNESAAAFRAFVAFLGLGPERTLREAAASVYGEKYRQSTARVPGTLKGWSSKFDWYARAWSFDAWLNREREEAVAEHVRRRATSLEERRIRLQERRLEIAEHVTERMSEMAASPLYTETTRAAGDGEEDGEVTIVKQPAGWSFSTLARLDSMVQSAISGKDGPQPEIVIAWNTLNDEEMNRVANHEDPRGFLDSDERGRLIGSGGPGE